MGEKRQRSALLLRKAVVLVLGGLLVMGMIISPIPASAAEKKQIGIMEINDKSIQGEGKQYVTGSRIIDMMTAELANTKSFVVCERAKITQILDEQALGLSGAVRADASAQIGELLGLNYMLYGKVVVADFEKGKDLLSSWKTAKVVVEARLVDVTTGVVVLAETAEGKSVAQQIFGSKAAPTQQELVALFEEASHKAAQKLTAKFNDLNPLYGVVVQNDDGKVYLDIGKMHGVRSGDKFKVFREGAPIINPSTKAIIGVNITNVGILKITEVMEKGAIAEITENGQDGASLQPGDKVKRAI